jgi:hypothetical protein
VSNSAQYACDCPVQTVDVAVGLFANHVQEDNARSWDIRWQNAIKSIVFVDVRDGLVRMRRVTVTESKPRPAKTPCRRPGFFSCGDEVALNPPNSNLPIFNVGRGLVRDCVR